MGNCSSLAFFNRPLLVMPEFRTMRINLETAVFWFNLENAIGHARVGSDWPDPARRDNAAPPWAQGGTTTLGASSRAQSGLERSHPSGGSIGSQKHQQNQVLIEGLKRSIAFSRFTSWAVKLLCWVGVWALCACGGGSGGGGIAVASTVPAVAAEATTQELQCQAAGWSREVVSAAGLQRLVLWKAPAAWSSGAVVVMHGGGGSHTNFCVANVASIAPQVRFTELALAQGFAVFLLDSSDQVSDSEGRVCGKVWDDEVRTRPNLDLPFIEDVLRRVIPAKRPVGGRSDVFVTGHSSGGYMALRAASRLPDWVTAFAPVSSGDAYGWFRDCTRRPGDRVNVAGAGFDNETKRQIIEAGACEASSYPNEKPWDGSASATKPMFRQFHHAQDGINDRSCVDKARRQLLSRGYAEQAPFMLDGGTRNADAHAWLDEYSAPMLAFFASRLR